MKPAVDVVAGLAGGGEGSISTFLDTLRVDESCGSMKDVKSLVKTMTLGLKTVLWCILTLGKSNAAGGAGASAGGADGLGTSSGSVCVQASRWTQVLSLFLSITLTLRLLSLCCVGRCPPFCRCIGSRGCPWKSPACAAHRG